MPRNRTRRNKTEGGSNCGMKLNGGKRRNKTEGGKRKTRKASKGPSDWNKKVMKIYYEMKEKNPATKLGDAMKRASALKKKGQL
jgi:hypothetical protein